MITENISTLKIHKLSQEQYDREYAAGNTDSTAIYLTPSNEDLIMKKIELVEENIEEISTDLINIKIPTKTSQLTNDSGFLTQHQDLSGYAKKATTLEGYGITDGATKVDLDELRESINNNNQISGNITSENITHAYGDLNILLSNLIENYMLNIDYDSLLSFDTDEIVVGIINVSSRLGQSVLGQMILAK